jgi:hypothetical protein
MRSALIFSAVAASAAVAPPRIELDLSAMSAMGAHTPIVGVHDLGITQPDGTAVASRQDYSERCPAGGSTDHTNCPFPNAKAYDHLDQAVTVTTRVKITDDDGTAKDLLVADVDFAQRSTYLFHYDAQDSHGNHAEQVLFMLELDDETKPTIDISPCGAAAQTVEANNGWTLCDTGVPTATDNIDGSLTPTYKVVNPTGGTSCAAGSSFATAAAQITNLVVGQFEITICAVDFANAYGESGQSNTHCVPKTVTVEDTTKPTIQIDGVNAHTQECSVAYVESGATVTDTLDTDGNGLTIAATLASDVDVDTVGDYTVTYNAVDANNNHAVEQTRVVHVRDTVAPTATLTGGSIVHYSGRTFADTGVTCVDDCDKALPAVTMAWNRPWDDKGIGHYTRTYTCCDASTNCHSVERNFEVIDDSQPIITIQGAEHETYEANNNYEYTDKGATCHDYVDGVLSHAVQVSGLVVHMDIPGVYVIRYDCEDQSGNDAEPMNRTVVVQDTQCPTLTLLGEQQVIIEAGFEYVDAGATATDDLDGTLSQCGSRHQDAAGTSLAAGNSQCTGWWTDGDTVTYASAFYSHRSCREIKSAYSAAGDGIYMITTYVAATKQFARTSVWCDMTSGAGNTYYAVVCGSEQVSPYTTAQQGDCANYGLKMAIFDANQDKSAAVAKFDATNFPGAAPATTNNYLCSTNDAAVADLATDPHHDKWLRRSNHISHDLISRAEAGKYVIFYHAKDAHDNHECSTLTRSVLVRDTLPPVITLHLKNQLIHQSKGDQVGIDSQANPAGDSTVNPYLASSYTGPTAGTVANNFMAEQAQTSSVNGWVIGAVASAVSGLALLANTLRKTDAAVSVPV